MISVIVRSFNDVQIIGRTLAALCRQQINDTVEILNLDSGSSDGTLAVVREFAQVRIIPDDGLPYNPARTLNRAVEAATGDILVFNNSDAVPLSDDYLAVLTAPLTDTEVGAVFGNQLPRSDAWPLVCKDHQRAFGDGRDAATWRHMYSMASSAARREIALRYPFDLRFQYSEDIEWSWRLKTQHGLRLVYVETAQVEHSHNYGLLQARKRFYNEGLANAMIWPEKPRFGAAAGQAGKEILRDWRYLWRQRQLGYLLPGLAYRIVQRWELYRGERDGFRKGNSSG